MQSIHVTSSTLQEQSARTRSAADNIQGQLNTLTGQINALQGTWQGAASTKFQDLYTRWQNSARELNDALGGMSVFLAQAAVSYDDTETSIAGAITG